MKYVNIIKAISNDSKYTKWYLNICDNAKNREILTENLEEHHIVPKSFGLGGETSKKNLVKLTLKEHFLVHRLLTKMLDGQLLKKMNYALWMMCNTRKNVKVNSRLYELAKFNALESFKGFKHSEESKQQMSDSRKEFLENTEYSRTQSEISKAIWEDSKMREHLTKCRQEYWGSEEAKSKQSAKRKEWFANPENAAKHAALNKEIANRPEVKKKISDSAKNLHKDPNYTKARVDAMHTPEAMIKSKAKNAERIKSMSSDERSKMYGNAKGSIWVTDGVINKKVKAGENIPDGFTKGRVVK